MANITEKIERQITALEGKIDALSGNYLTNTWKRQREQQERDRKKEMYHSQIQVLQFLKQKSETDTLTLLEQNLTVAAFYEDMRCFSASKKYCKDNPYCKFQYPKPDDVRTKRLQRQASPIPTNWPQRSSALIRSCNRLLYRRIRMRSVYGICFIGRRCIKREIFSSRPRSWQKSLWRWPVSVKTAVCWSRRPGSATLPTPQRK